PSAGAPSRHAVEQAESEVGRAVIVTTATATIGFASLSVARFLPIRYFGLLTSVAMIVALAAALFLLPALLGLRYHRRGTDRQGTDPEQTATS
ncbi:MAG: MMPL family transporter, partial [Myxococcota bacterium]